MTDYKNLEDYGIIGNLSTCALVGKDGSIDWCCFPHIESTSVFAGILDAQRGGHFTIQPLESFKSSQEYVPNTNVLKTIFHVESGVVTLTDFMPMDILDKDSEENLQIILRNIKCEEGTSKLELNFKPRFDYARSKTTLKISGQNVLASSKKEMAFLTGSIPLIKKDNCVKTDFQIQAGESIWFALQYNHRNPFPLDMCNTMLQNTIDYWEEWRHHCEDDRCVFQGPWHNLITRSGLVLKLLTHSDTGGICAAPTTSLPEEIGGIRNWDYRYTWIRDASFTVQALYNLGHIQEAKQYLKWFQNICLKSGDPADIQIMYGLHGESDLEERELNHLSGYRESKPVRIGNGAAKQKQLDIYGELIQAIYDTSRYGEELSDEIWGFIQQILDYVCDVWDTPDAGIWEMRGEHKHFVYSKLMCWVALDRGIRMTAHKEAGKHVARWQSVRETIRIALLQKGFNEKLNSFVQAFESDNLDATSLLIPIMGFLPFKDSRVQGTINATLKNLATEKGLVYRYKSADGLPGGEGIFVLCTFWLINSLILSNRIDEAESIFQTVLSYVSPLGLLAEEIDPNTGKQLGNFPQAFSHIGLINSALYLGRAKGAKQRGPKLLGHTK